MFRATHQEANISRLVESVDLESLRNVMTTLPDDDVHAYTQNALIQMAREDPFVRTRTGFKTSMGLKKRTNEVKANYPDIRTDKSVITFDMVR